MATRAQVSALLDRGHSYEAAGRMLHIPAGQVFMIATGVPADGGDAVAREDPSRQLPPGGPQQLVNPPVSNPQHSPQVLEWVRARAARELNGDEGGS